ncbi:DUF6005 family protein [Paenibacillus xanthanilyticus]|uniref:DUF6005 family protein n=1 Tax=Paenibacillus xanthanilyticus TaxID=1783531 RepID=A0ABV8K8Z4_9BACL
MKKRDQIHCMLDCYAWIIERAGFDSRPLYSGVWEASYDVNERGIAYFGEEIDPKRWHERVRRLYNAAVVYWCDYEADKSVNFAKLLDTLDARGPDGAFVLTVDLYHFPHAPQFGSRHLPHIVVFEVRADGEWRIVDPYFSWSGGISRDALRAGFLSGVRLDTAGMRDAAPEAAAELFRQDIHLGVNPLIGDVERFVREAIRRNDGYAPSTLFDAIQQTGVIAKRFGGYLRVFRYLAGRDEEACEALAADVRTLIQGWENFMLTIARLGLLKRAVDWPALSGKLASLHEREAGIREKLLRSFASWRSLAGYRDECEGINE